jgi:hypothetical protein
MISDNVKGLQMGSSNSGNHGGKSCTSDKRALDVRQLQRGGFLKPGRSIGWTWSRNGKPEANIDIQVHTDMVKLVYQVRQNGGEQQSMNYPVRLAWTACHYGGQRAWWLCPVAGCGRRVAVLYGGAVFACRHCQKLAYKCQRETPDERATRRADKLRDRLGWQAGILNQAGSKPKGMHWQTFWQMQASHDAHVMQALAGMSAKLGLGMTRLNQINMRLDDL